MDSKQVEQLLEKYWNCETSLEEEKQLRDFFRGEAVPESMKEAAELFRYFEGQQQEQISEPNFDKTIRVKLQSHRPPAKVMKLMFNTLRIAAGLVVVVAATYFVRQEIRKSYPPEVADTYSDPKLAFEETKKALLMISKSFGKAKKEVSKVKLFNEAEQKLHQGKNSEKEKQVTI